MMRKTTGVIRKRTVKLLRIMAILGICAMLPLSAISAAAAENEELDPERVGSISITFKDPESKKPLGSENEVGLYKVADVSTENGYHFVLKDTFATAGSALAEDKDLNEELANKLDKIIKNDNLAPDAASRKIDKEGKVSFEDLSVGLYLVVQTAKGSGQQAYTINSFLVTIPLRNADGTLSYDVNATPKVGVKAPPKPPRRTPPRLPQTGQQWLPVIALGAAGVLLVTVGMLRKKRM